MQETQSSSVRFKVVEFVQEFFLICSNAKKFNRVNESIYKSASLFEQKIIEYISSTGFSKTLMGFIERNDQLKLLDLIKSKITSESSDNKPKKSKVKYQKINPWIKGSSRHEYFKLDPVVS